MVADEDLTQEIEEQIGEAEALVGEMETEQHLLTEHIGHLRTVIDHLRAMQSRIKMRSVN